jgi:hypothetical protein
MVADLTSTFTILGIDALSEHALRLGRETPFIRPKRSPWQRRRLRAWSDGTRAILTLTERRLRKKQERQNRKQGRR